MFAYFRLLIVLATITVTSSALAGPMVYGAGQTGLPPQVLNLMLSQCAMVQWQISQAVKYEMGAPQMALTLNDLFAHMRPDEFARLRNAPPSDPLAYREISTQIMRRMGYIVGGWNYQPEPYTPVGMTQFYRYNPVYGESIAFSNPRIAVSFFIPRPAAQNPRYIGIEDIQVTGIYDFRTESTSAYVTYTAADPVGNLWRISKPLEQFAADFTPRRCVAIENLARSWQAAAIFNGPGIKEVQSTPYSNQYRAPYVTESQAPLN